MTAPAADGVDPGAAALIDELVALGVVRPSDVEIADRLAALWTGAPLDPVVRLGVALAVRAPRLGHVCCDLALVADSVTTELPAAATPGLGGGDDRLLGLRWPALADWRQALATSDLVAVAGSWDEWVGPEAERPFVLSGTRLYLQRYWSYESEVARDLAALASTTPPDTGDVTAVAEALLPGPASADQRLAVQRALARRLGVIAGGPGTGKTTTIAALLVAAHAAGGHRPLRVVLAAPTGKAAARVNEALRTALAEFAASPPAELADQLHAALGALEGVEATTLHRLLGARGGPRAAFAHDRRTPLPYDVVVVDEASMVALPLMAHLLAAIAPHGRLILVGDPHQLASVEAGSVLTDLVGPESVGPESVGPVGDDAPGAPVRAVTTVLHHNFRFAGDSGIAAAARAINAGDVAAVLDAFERGGDVTWQRLDPADGAGRTAVLDAVAGPGAAVATAARTGDGAVALEALGRCQLLCAHRRGPYGVERWNRLVGARLGVTDAAPAGRPVLVTRNDPDLGVFNGDIGVQVDHGRPRVLFPTADGLRSLAPAQLEHTEVAHALTIHKSQGSEFDEVVVVLPPESSRLASRELLYTAVTRARHRVAVVGTAAALSAAVHRRLRRQGGLADRLWGVDHPRAGTGA